jgi:hypothetical protein
MRHKGEFMTTEVKPTYEQLKALAMTALTDGNDTEFLKISGQMRSFKAEIAKAEADKLQKEAQAMAGDRAKLAEKILARIVSQFKAIPAELEALKATGFTFYLPDDSSITPRVGLSVPTLKAKTARTGGGSTGKSKGEYGLTLDEIYQKFKTGEDEVKMSEAIAKDEQVKAEKGKSNSVNQYNVKLAVKKNAIAEGKLKPVS